MKAKKFGVALLTVSIIMIIAGMVCTFVVSLKEDKELTYARMLVVSDEFDGFNANVTAFEKERDSLYNQYLGNIFYDTLRTDDQMLKEKINNYESVVDGIVEQVNTMADLCDDVYYPDSSVNSKCSDYKLIYEQVVNYFVNDINLYNNTIKTFNEQHVSAESEKLVEYKTKKKYIDFNKDGEFDGKEVK